MAVWRMGRTRMGIEAAREKQIPRSARNDNWFRMVGMKI